MKKTNAKALTMTRRDQRALEFLCRQAEAKEWIEKVIGEKLVAEDIHTDLSSGIVLCKLANILWPGSISLNQVAPEDSFAFKLRENIGLYLSAARNNGRKEEQLFGVEDLFEKKNLPRVLISLHHLATDLCKKGFRIAWPNRSEVVFEEKKAIQDAKKLSGLEAFDEKPKENETLTSDQKTHLHESHKHEDKDKDKMETQSPEPSVFVVDEKEEMQRNEAKQKREQQQLEAQKQLEEEQLKLQIQLQKQKEFEDELEVRRLADQEKQKQIDLERQQQIEQEKQKQIDLERQKQQEALPQPRATPKIPPKQVPSEDELIQKYGSKTKLENIRQIIVELEKRLTFGNSVLHVAAHRFEI